MFFWRAAVAWRISLVDDILRVVGFVLPVFCVVYIGDFYPRDAMAQGTRDN